MLEHLTFRSENRFQPVIEALAVIKQSLLDPLRARLTAALTQFNRELPSIVTRPVITSMAQAIRLNWRRVVAVTWDWRQSKSATMAIVGFFVG